MVQLISLSDSVFVSLPPNPQSQLMFKLLDVNSSMFSSRKTAAFITESFNGPILAKSSTVKSDTYVSRSSVYISNTLGGCMGR